MPRLYPHYLLVPALNLCAGAAMAAAPLPEFGTWTDMGTSGITASCTPGFTCTTGTVDAGFLQRQVNNSGGDYVQTIVTGDGATASSDPLPLYENPPLISLLFPVQGQITDTESGQPIAGIEVSVFYANGYPASGATPILSDETGHYTTPTLPAGIYLLKAEGNQTYQAELYDGQPCPGACDLTAGTEVTINIDNTPAPVDFALARGGHISGSITDSDTGQPLQDITVMVIAENGVLASSATTNVDGVYETGTALPAGKYFVHTVNSSSYIDERYNGTGCLMSCSFFADTAIEITHDETVTGVDFSLAKGGQISGMVTAAADDSPLANITVMIDDENGSPVLNVSTDSTGHYHTGAGLAAGRYYLRTANRYTYINRIYDGPDCLTYDCDVTTGSQVEVARDALTSAVDFSLTRGGGISGTISDALSGFMLPAAIVYIYDADGALVDIVNAVNGLYQSGNGLPSGTYFAATGNFLGYINERYNDLPLAGYGGVNDGTAITVLDAQITVGIDFVLDKGSMIHGTISSEAGALEPTTTARVLIFDQDGDPVSMAYADKDGSYTSGASLPPGEYYVEAEDSSGKLDSKLYGDTSFTGSCTAWQRCNVLTGNPVNISAGSDAQEINFVLSAKVSADKTTGTKTVSTATSGSGTVSLPMLLFLLLAGVRGGSRRALRRRHDSRAPVL